MSRILLAIHPQWYGPILEERSVEELKVLPGVEEIIRDEKIPYGERTSEADSAVLAARLAETGADILVTCWYTPKLTLEGYHSSPRLKYLCHLAGTVKGIVAREAIEEGLLVTNWGNVISRTIAEAALMMILATLRRVATYQVEMHRRGSWRLKHVRPRSLYERRVGLHGLGAIAQELVRLLKPFGCRIEAYSPHAPDSVFNDLGVIRQESLRELYATNDIVSIHASDTPENRHIVNAELLAAMPDGAVLVNTARGAIIDTAALVRELRSGRIHAALDVYEKEPLPPDDPLREIEDLILFPHEAGPTDDRKVDMGRLAVRNIRRYLAGERPEHVVTADRYELMT
jgi:phosphoglycerate dehydrogenase-like enzyme